MSTGLLRFATAGSVDDGKSTLIGRLLYDSKSVFQDQLESVERTSADRGDDYTNLALLTDGLRAEREQGITIDVAYRYFSTPARSFIVADTPGHVQYTRNMVTGASTADLALVLVDARKGVVEQTRRHASLSALLRVPHLVLAVNKMDLVDYDQATYDAIVADFVAFAGKLDLPDVTAIPMAALQGDNVVHRSEQMPWYDGPALLEHLEQVDVSREEAQAHAARFPVQYVIRPMSTERPDYRGYAGTLAAGSLRVGDQVVALPSGRTSTVEALETFDGPLDEAVAGQAITVRLADEIDVSRGDMIVPADSTPTVTSSFEAMVCWMADAPLRSGQRVLVKHTTRTVKAQVQTLHDRLDVTQLQPEPADTLRLNDIGRVTLRTASPLAVDPYSQDRTTGAFIVIDEATGTTVGAGMVAAPRLNDNDRVSYPLHLDVTGRRVLVVGGGAVAVRRVRSLVDAGAAVEVVAPSVDAEMPAVPLQRRAFAASDVEGAWLVHACTGTVDADVAAACEERRIWCVRADDATQSHAWVPAVHRGEDVVVSVTAGRDPRRAMALRDAIALALDSGSLPLRRRRTGTGSVALVGGGPGDPGLLTVRARQLLAGADVVVRDRLAPQVDLPPEVEVVDVGKSSTGPSYDQRDIELLLVERAQAGQRVVRLKGGDVHVFARGIEEVAACVEAGVAVEVVPGVSSAFAVPAYAGIPVTARGVTQSVAVVSAHLPPGAAGSTVDWDALARLGGTLVLLMGADRLAVVCAALVAGGRAGSTPVAVIRDGTLPTQAVDVATLDTASDLVVRPPSVVVIGEVVAERR